MPYIELFGIISTKHLTKYGIDPILEALMHDIRFLEQVLICITELSYKTKTFLTIIVYTGNQYV